MAKKVIKKDDFGLDIEEMAKAGLHFGHKTSKVHPKMEPYLYGVRKSVHIIDLEQTQEKFKEALIFIDDLVSENKTLLVIGTKIQAKELVKDFAEKFSFPYTSERWLGGTFTNFDIIRKRIDFFKDLEEQRKKGELVRYTKKERLKISRQLDGFEKKFGGIKNLEKLPDAIFVLDMEKDALAIKEAREKQIKVIGISDTSADPTMADFPVPANDDAVNSIKYILDKVSEVVEKAKKKAEIKLKKEKNKEKKEESKAEEIKDKKQ